MAHRFVAMVGLCVLAFACGGEDETSGGGSGGSSGSSGSGGSGAYAGSGGTGPVDCDGNCQSWCDVSTWPSAKLPTASDEVVIPSGKHVVVDCDAEAKSIVVEPGGSLNASRTTSATLTVHGNLAVYGRLDYGRADSRVPLEVSASIVFTGMQDDATVGTPSTVFGDDRGPSASTAAEVLETDIGLWVMGEGTLSAAGTEKRAWSFLVESATPGSTSFTVEDASGWQAGDKVVLTPTAERAAPDHLEQFDEGTIQSVSGNTVTLESAPQFEHAGCADCVRRGEAANLTRNVVIRSFDDGEHAHVFVGDQARVEIDSAELRWLGPEWGEPNCGGPARRAALHFHQQDDASRGSFVRHAAIWGGDQGFVSIERSHGVQVEDVVGYDAYGNGFSMFYDTSACGTRCNDRDTAAPKDVIFNGVLAAKISPSRRKEGCLRISHRHTAIVVSGGEGSGSIGSVATGAGVDGSGADMSGFAWAEGGSGRPLDFTFEGNVAHNNANHGAFVWHNATELQEPYTNNAFWSNEGAGVRFGAYGNHYRFAGLESIDNGQAGLSLKSVPGADSVRVSDARLSSMHIEEYVLVQTHPQHLKDIEFVPGAATGVTQFQATCSGGDENDPADPKCSRIELLIENVSFPAGMKPFLFGDSINFHTIWQIRNFSHPDYPSLPASFDLHRRDNTVEGGSYNADFDAWLVPR